MAVKGEEGGGVPEDVVGQLKEFHEKLTKIEESLEDYFVADSGNIELLDTLDRARLGLMTLYSANSLYWVYLCTKGHRPSENEALMTELERIKEYMRRLKSIEDRVKAPKLNPRAAKAFVRNALFHPSEEKEKSCEPEIGSESCTTTEIPAPAAEHEKHTESKGQVNKSRKRRL